MYKSTSYFFKKKFYFKIISFLLQELSENFDSLINNPSYISHLDTLIRTFILLLQETSPQFISENNTMVIFNKNFLINFFFSN